MELDLNICKLKTNFSKYIKLLESKEIDRIVVVQNGNKVAQLTLIEESSQKVRVGAGHKYAPTMDFDLKNEIFKINDSFGY